MSHTKNEAREIALTLSSCDAKALIDGKRLLLRHANKPSLELRIGTPLGDAVADLVEKDVAPRGYKISSLDVGSHGRFWQAHLDVDHSLEDNSEAGAIAACHRHQNRIVRDAIHDLLEQIEDYVDPAGLRDVAQEIKKRLKL